MVSIRACDLPEIALLRKYLQGGAYTDCFVTEVAIRATHTEYVEAFYTSTVFKLERWLLARFISRPYTEL